MYRIIPLSGSACNFAPTIEEARTFAEHAHGRDCFIEQQTPNDRGEPTYDIVYWPHGGQFNNLSQHREACHSQGYQPVSYDPIEDRHLDDGHEPCTPF